MPTGQSSTARPTVVVFSNWLLEETARAITETAAVEVRATADPERARHILNHTGATILVCSAWDERIPTDGLRWVQLMTSGVDGIPVDVLRRQGITVTTAHGIHQSQMADHAIGLLLALLRRLPDYVRDAQERAWRPRTCHELAELGVVVLGLGPVGLTIMERLEAWDVRVRGVTRRPDRHRGKAAAPFDALVPECAAADILIVALPLTTRTRAIVGDAVVDALAPGWLVNVSRGELLDEAAVCTGLKEGRLLGAGLDTFAQEPLPPNSPLWDKPNVILTPHVAGRAPAYARRVAELFAANLDVWHRSDVLGQPGPTSTPAAQPSTDEASVTASSLARIAPAQGEHS